jgi:hypothetical protein
MENNFDKTQTNKNETKPSGSVEVSVCQNGQEFERLSKLFNIFIKVDQKLKQQTKLNLQNSI